MSDPKSQFGYMPTSTRCINLSGLKLGRLTVLSLSHQKKAEHYWLCRCDCGVTKVMDGRSMVRGIAKSCGCYNREMTKLKNSTHGLTKSNMYKLWVGIIQRCVNPNAPHFEKYGGRGIGICDEWRFSFERFNEYVGRRPSMNHTIDRINVNDNYEPGNVRWATRKEQQENRRDNIKITINGVTENVTYWANISGTNRNTIITRYFRGYKPEDCVYRKSQKGICPKK